MRRVFSVAALGCLLSLLATGGAVADVVVHISKSSQQMSVSVNGEPRYRWLVSTGRRGFGTPSGSFRPQRLERRWYSTRYYNAPMPYSIFFHEGYAIHGTTELRRLGGEASHGCVRLHPGNAATLFGLVRRYGMGNTRIIVSEMPLPESPRRRLVAVARAGD